MINKITEPTISYNIYRNKKQTSKHESFKGLETPVLSLLRGLNNSPAVGACAVDLCSMVIPRTMVEFNNRGIQAGIETSIREGTSCVIHACVGLIGLGAATLLSGKINNEYGIKANKIFSNADTINNISSIWRSANGDKQKFFDGFLKGLKGLSGEEWKEISETANKNIVPHLVKLADKTKEAATDGKNSKKLIKEVKEIKEVISSLITQNTGANASFKLTAPDGSQIKAGINDLVDSAVAISNSMQKQASDKVPGFLNALKNNKTATTLLGMGICALLCMAVQPVNRYLTKKRTGIDAFVGVEEKKSDDSKKFKTIKTIAGVGFPIFAMNTIVPMSKIVTENLGVKGWGQKLLSSIQFNGKIPTINQFKFLYGLTIGSRFLSARDGNELRESVIKDTLGFTNWLILGGMVSKIAARVMGGKELINNPVAQDGAKKGLGYALKWITQSSVKSFDEVILPEAKEVLKNGKAIKFKELYKNADSAVKSKVLKIAGSQVLGYLYSGIVLGVGISKLNIAITKHLASKKKQINNNARYDFNFLAKETNPVFKEFK